MKKLFTIITLLLAAVTLVACSTPKEDTPITELPPVVTPEPQPEPQPEPTPEPQPEPTPATPTEPEKVEITYTFIFKAIQDLHGKSIQTSASKITYEEEQDLFIKSGEETLNFKALGFALASGQKTGLNNEFILKSDANNKGYIVLNVEEELEVEIDLHMWFTASSTNYFGSLELENLKGTTKLLETLDKNVTTVKMKLEKGKNTITYTTASTSDFATQIVFKEIRITK